jgi:HK97 family phage major capsid protein
MSQAIKERIAQNREALRTLADTIEADGLTDENRAEADRLKAEIRNDEDALEMVAEARAAAPAPAAPEVKPDVRAIATPASSSPQIDVRAKSPYAPESGHSWFADRRALINSDATDSEIEEARGRLVAHYESANEEGSARAVRTYSAGTTTEGGYLVAPQYLQSLFKDLLSAGRPTANLVASMPLPAAGKTFYIPTQDGATAVAVHTENNAATETTATFAQVQVDAARVAGAATLPNWLIDRSFPGADQIVMRDLAKVYAKYINTIVLNSSTSNRKGLLQESGLGASTATATTPTITTYWPALLNAINDVASGVFEYPDAIVMHPRRWAYLASLLDGSNRPLIGSIAPQNAAGSYNGVEVPGSGTAPVATGNILGIPVYLDAGIPTDLGSGTNEDRIIVMKRSEPLLMESTPKFAVSDQAEFLKDQTLLRVTGDVAFTCALRKGAVSVISGTALAATI